MAKEPEQPVSAGEEVPLSPESMELYKQFWAQIGDPATTTVPPMDFLELKADALKWGERLKLEAGILAKFRQLVSSAQRDTEVYDVMERFLEFARTPSQAEPGGAATHGGDPATTSAGAGLSVGPSRRKGRRAMTLIMLRRALEMVADGLSNRAIAAELGISVTTVKRNAAVQEARARSKAVRRADTPRGHKSKSGAIEAYDAADEDGDPEDSRPR